MPPKPPLPEDEFLNVLTKVEWFINGMDYTTALLHSRLTFKEEEDRALLAGVRAGGTLNPIRVTKIVNESGGLLLGDPTRYADRWRNLRAEAQATWGRV